MKSFVIVLLSILTISNVPEAKQPATDTSVATVQALEAEPTIDLSSAEIVATEPLIEPVIEPTPDPIQDNPNGCDLVNGVVWEDYSCHPKPTPTPTPAPASKAPVYTGGGNKDAWLLASGIPESEWVYVDYIVSKESGWNPCAYNPGKSDCNANPRSACGLAQSLPCGKQSKYGHWTDPVANLKWQYDYVVSRYGGYEQAYNHWLENKWY